MVKIRDIIADFSETGIISDENIDVLLKHYELLSNMLHEHGNLYKLTWLHSVSEYERLLSMKNSRNVRKTKTNDKNNNN